MHNSIIVLLFFACIGCGLCGKFYYFAYGSNLTGKRLKLNSPSAEFYSVAVLKDHRLDFNNYYAIWNGACATIVEDAGTSVTGVLWLIDDHDLEHLDIQEGIHEGDYYAKNVTVTTVAGEQIVARTYAETVDPPRRLPGEDLPHERRPSNTYLQVLIFGAVESGLPSDYIGYLVSFPTNGNHAPDEIRRKLGYPFGPESHVLIFGAVESGLPSDYIGYLVSFPTNGNQAPDEIRRKLGYPFGPESHVK